MKAASINYDPTRSEINAGNVQDAIDQMKKLFIDVEPVELTGDADASEVFKEGIYTYASTCAHTPSVLNAYTWVNSSDHSEGINTVSSAGRLIVLHNTDKHITQIALPNADPDDLFIRHYAQHPGEGYSWTVWYSVSLNNFRMVAPDLAWNASSGSRGYVKCFGKTINPTNFPSSIFMIDAMTTSSEYSRYLVVVGSSTASVTKLYNSSDYPELKVSSSNSVYVRMTSAGTAPAANRDVYLDIKKVR